MNIAVISGRGFPSAQALSWLEKSGLLGRGCHWRVAPEGAGASLVRELLRRGERVTLYLPSTPPYVSARWHDLIQFLEKSNCVSYGRDEFPRGEHYRERNKAMLLKSGLLVAFWDGKEGALEWTTKKAQKMKKKIIIVRKEEK